MGPIVNFFTGGETLGGLIQTGQIKTDAFAGQCFMEGRQCRNGAADHGHDRIGNRTRAIEHAVQQTLDFPAEFAQRLGTDKPAAAFQRMENAADRTDEFDVFGVGLPVLEERR